jgi:tetratricopeptide (TPR) repeat protein
MRIADGYFVLKDNEQAVKFYSNALALKVGYEDQALYYRAKTYGYMEGKTTDRISSLLDIVNNYKGSKYLQISIMEIAESYKSIGQFDKAVQYYKKIVFDYPSSNLVVDAKINIADIHYKQNKYNDSEDIYLEVLEEYGADQKVCKRVAEGLVDLYIAMNKPERIEALAAEHNCFEFSADEQENLYYLPAVEVYGDSAKAESVRYTEAIPKFNKYLDKFPGGRYKNEVKNYLANCHYKLGDTLKAIEIYIETLEGSNTGFTELAASRVANYLYNDGQYEDVIKYYKRLEQIASTPEVIFSAKLGLMRSNFLIENWPNAALYSDKVLANTQLSSELKLEAYYSKGMSNFYLKHFNDARPSLEWLVKNTTTIKGAEAQYSIASLDYQQDNLVEADGEIAKLLKMKPTYNYWVAKGLILRARILMQMEDLFGAEQNLKSILDHYPYDDDGVMDEAQELYDELMQLKNQEKVVEPEVDPIIEINEQGN